MAKRFRYGVVSGPVRRVGRRSVSNGLGVQVFILTTAKIQRISGRSHLDPQLRHLTRVFGHCQRSGIRFEIKCSIVSNRGRILLLSNVIQSAHRSLTFTRSRWPRPRRSVSTRKIQSKTWLTFQASVTWQQKS